MYNGSEKHKENARNALRKAAEGNQRKKQIRILEYNENPKKCKFCKSSLSYKDRRKKFCNSSCAAKFNNTGRVRSTESKLKTSKLITKFWSENNANLTFEKRAKQAGGGKNYCKIKISNCSVCDSPFVQRSYGVKKTCSRECQIIASTSRTYRNGSRKTIHFDNPNQGPVVLESSWELEVAELLCERNIKWIRPQPIRWFDYKGKTHLYYPDFYLIDQNIYLDPKNPYCMELDKEKMEYIEQKVKIQYGDIEIIKEYINNI